MFSGVFAAAINNRTSVFQEDEDTLKPLRQKAPAQPGSYRMLSYTDHTLRQQRHRDSG